MEQHKQIIKMASDNYDTVYCDIEMIIADIRKKVSQCNPLHLMNYMAMQRKLSSVKELSDIGYNINSNFISTITEYFQSVLVSTENHYSETDMVQEDVIFEELLQSYCRLQQKLIEFNICWATQIIDEDESILKDNLQYILESTSFQNVRGERYQIYQIEHISELIKPHHEIFEKLFDMKISDFIQGLKNLEIKIPKAMPDMFNRVNDIMSDLEIFLEHDHTEAEVNEFYTKFLDRSQFSKEEISVSIDYNIKATTGWNDKLIDLLSYKLNECEYFFNQEKFAGWPIIDLPTQKRPFIKIGAVSYCFDYYALFDNIYRVLQKRIKALEPTYTDCWAKIQQHTTERLVENLMQKILSQGDVYRDNYYPKNKSLKDCAENDIIATFDNILFIVEVKAGSFTFTPAITDLKAHIKSFQKLIEEADYQCNRTLEYIMKNDKSIFYDNNKVEKFTIDKSSFSDIYTICVTVDNFNTFANKVEKLSFIQLQSSPIAISVDDLRVYSDIFDTPLEFLHYLKERKKATTIPQIQLSDELDHLGLYLSRNLYTMDAEELPSDATFSSLDAREKIDEYYNSLYIGRKDVKKPEQYIPQKIKEILKFISNNKNRNRVLLSNFLLDLDFQSRDEFADGIQYIINRQKELGRMIKSSTYEGLRYTLYVFQSQIAPMPYEECLDRVYIDMLKNNERYRLAIFLRYNNDELTTVEIRNVSFIEIPENKKEYLLSMSNVVPSYQQPIEQKIKVGRNEKCPCCIGK